MTALNPGLEPLFAAQVASEGEHALVRLIGELDVAVAPTAEQAIVQAERHHPRLLEIDLSKLAFMDSTGLRLMLQTRERSLAAERQLVLRRGPSVVHRVFEVTALTSRFEFLD
jgi:anti-anti-sigma factor